MQSIKLMIICCCVFLTSFVIAEVRDTKQEEAFPKEVSFDYQGNPLKLRFTGAAIRKKFFVSIYDVAHYLQEGTAVSGPNKFQAILNDGKAKQLTFKWARTIDAAKVKEGYNESFKKSLSAPEYEQLKNEITQFLSFFNQEVRKGDEYILQWLPGGQIEVIIKGNKMGSIANLAFVKAMWSIWFGDKSVVDREKLVSNLK